MIPKFETFTGPKESWSNYKNLHIIKNLHLIYKRYKNKYLYNNRKTINVLKNVY